eukprot:COSAG02_NODE_24644_length_681_cov_1.778351_1_plen_35_part_01
MAMWHGSDVHSLVLVSVPTPRRRRWGDGNIITHIR